MTGLLHLEERQVNKYREIALDYLTFSGQEVQVVPIGPRAYGLCFSQPDGAVEFYSDQNGEAVTLKSEEQARQVMLDSCLPSLGLNVQLDRIRTFQTLLTHA